MPTPRPDNLAVLERRIAPADANGCRLWLGATSINGYGNVQLDRRSVRVHRLIYEIAHGPVPSGFDVHHECGVKLCVNVAHLRAVSHSEHGLLHRREQRTRAGIPVTHCCHGHPYDDENTYVTKDGGRLCRACDRERKRLRYARARLLSPCLEVL